MVEIGGAKDFIVTCIFPKIIVFFIKINVTSYFLGVRIIAPEENLPLVRVRVMVRISVRVRVRGNFPRGQLT